MLTPTPGASPDGCGFHAGIDAQVTVYSRLAAMDPPVLRWLIVELKRVSDESAASAALQGTPEAAARAHRNAERVAAARAALDSIEPES